MPEFIVLHTVTPDGAQKTWTELGRLDAPDAATAFQKVAPLDTGVYLVLPLVDQLTATVKTTITVGEA